MMAKKELVLYWYLDMVFLMGRNQARIINFHV